ncbi:MAG: SH3 domain-containing protein [Lachnospiraceae bacterium]|nr:SH3 domain-containing protein [Lachnospiraceae bacterium]
MKRLSIGILAGLTILVAALFAGCSNADFSPSNASEATTESKSAATAATTDTMSGAVRPSSDPAFMTQSSDSSEESASSSGSEAEASQQVIGVSAEITSNVNLRDGPGGDTITTISEGTMVQVLGRHGSWYHISNEGEEGYVYKNYINVSDEDNVPDETADETGGTNNTDGNNADGYDNGDTTDHYDTYDTND